MDGRLVSDSRHAARDWEIIVEPDVIRHLLVVITAYPVDQAECATLRAIRQLARDRPTVYLPTHDAESAARLASRRLVDDVELAASQVATASSAKG